MLNVSEWKIHRDLVIAQVAYGDNDGKTIFRCFDLNKDTRKTDLRIKLGLELDYKNVHNTDIHINFNVIY